ncbi:TIGR04197 family type VII secretion effector [Oceanobacillus sp. CFH 90083]|uniref:TIGR04197 family type VII secretion effector n=1 Tax=Oceanobacillus sp. CFH 90083 TaxID=2592336 RepID=UPI00128D9FC2|nr:TIGR04197 family type VII secretion effector [Oceanobacillus sp. CFH 90083]
MSWEIQSNTEAARQIATNIAMSLDNLSSAGIVTKDSETTVAGNESAHEAIDASLHARQNIVEVIRNSCQNLQLVAEEFEAIDQEISNHITSSPLSTRLGGNW